MKFEFDQVGVDSGTIMICDEEYYKKYGYKFDKKISHKKEVPPGSYLCHWNIPDSWNGKVGGDGILEVTSGTIIVSDPCYCVDQWDKLLNDSNMLENPPDGTLVLDSMGGDGVYIVEVSLQPV